MPRVLSALVLASMLLVGAGCRQNTEEEEAAMAPVSLSVWGVFENESGLRQLFDAYHRIHPNVSFEYRAFRFEEYEEELIRSFARGDGPDIFAIHHTGVNEYRDLIVPLPGSLRLPYSEVQGTLKKETVVNIREERSLSLRELRTDFVDAVIHDVVRGYQPTPSSPSEERVFALPFSFDTLALYINRDLLNSANIATPPQTWSEFQEDIRLLTALDRQGNIVRSGAALGGARNVERAADLVSVLMMQNGAVMANDRGGVTFGQAVQGVSVSADAIRFYTDFANPTRDVYTWNEEMPNSLDAFVAGQTAFFFGYSYHLPTIERRAPRLNLQIAPLPQIAEGQVVNSANYWVETVARASEHQEWAWDFIQFGARAPQARLYLAEAERPTARRDVLIEQAEEEQIGIFASQALTAETWYAGRDAAAMEEAFLTLIEEVLEGQPAEAAVQRAQNKVNQTL